MLILHRQFVKGVGCSVHQSLSIFASFGRQGNLKFTVMGLFDGFIYLPGGRFEGGNESSVSGEERFNPFSFSIFSKSSFRVSLS